MIIRLLRPVSFRRVGMVMDVPDGVGEMWIMQGKAERCSESAASPQCMVPAQTINVSAAPRRRRVTAA